MRLKIMVAATASVLMIVSAQAQDGARAYFLLPAGTNDIDLTATLIHAEFDGSVFDSTVFTPSYRRAIDISGDAAEFLIGVPAGSLSASLNTPFGIIESHTVPAQGDLFVGGTLGLVGSPALSPMQYAQFKPGIAISVATKLFLPTGDYNSTRLLNLGGNRWSLQTSLPIVYTLGNSFLDPDLTTFEIVPSVQVFGDNKDAFGPATVVSEAPLFEVEGHVTHSFGQFGHGLWASVDGSAAFGGETSSDGVANLDAQQSATLGATLGFSLSQSVAVRLNYEEQVYSKVPNSASRTFMATTAFLF